MRDELAYGERVHAIGVKLRCQFCERFAYTDRYEGWYDGRYTCIPCQRLNRLIEESEDGI